MQSHDEKVRQTTSKAAAYRSNRGCEAIVSASSGFAIQPKLTVNKPNDVYEQEANKVADQIITMTSPVVQSKPLSVSSLQRTCAHCEEEKNMQRKALNGQDIEGNNQFQSYVDNLGSGGRSLSKESLNYFEPRFGYDFSNVKIHTGKQASESSNTIMAKAFTTGNNIVFNEGEYAPHNAQGKHLLAHELTHVVQQGAAPGSGNVQRWDWEDAGIGALAGGAAGAVIGGLAGGGAGALIGGAAGAVAGGLIGGLSGASPEAAGGCTATATGVSLGTSSSVNDGSAFGLITPITVRGTELADVLDSELVSTSADHTGSMTDRPSSHSTNSGFMPADNIPDDHHTESITDFLDYFDNHGGDGGFSRLQIDLFKIPKCGINSPQSMPNSGYRIKKEVKQEGSKVVGIVTKTAEAVTVDGKSSTPGLTPSRQAKVTLRP